VEQLYTMAPNGRYNYDGGWNKVGLMALGLASVIAIGWEFAAQLFHVIPENNFGWFIGAIAGAVIYMVMMRGAKRT
jgi:NCS1 family nucleobase:cation symporter-1